MSMEKLRIDKYLWAARFFKTRSIAKAAIEGGKVHFNGKRVKVSKDVQVGMRLTIRQGSATSAQEKEIEITKLSDKRGSAADAALLYRETDESITRRAAYSEQRKLANLARPDSKPSKKDRRKLKQFRDSHSDNYGSDDEGY